MWRQVRKAFPKIPLFVLSLVKQRWFGSLFLTFFVVFVVSLFFITYSLARHKRLIARLRATVIEQQAKVRLKDLELQKSRHRIKLMELQKTDQIASSKREEIKKKIYSVNHKIESAQKDLLKKRKQVGKDSVDELIRKAKTLTKETL